MFTLKFWRIDNDDQIGDGEWDVVCVPHYHKYLRKNGCTTITTYSDLFSKNGIERHVSELKEHFDACFIENLEGKTIDHIRAPVLVDDQEQR